MDIDSIFKAPTAPATKGGAKRKLVSPDELYRKNARHTSYEELTGRSFDPIEASTGGEGSSSSKRRTVSMEDEEDEETGNMDFGNEDEDDRFFGDGLTSDQKDILDYVDEINPEEEIFDLGAVRKMILKFERSINKNQEMRIKYADDAAKFMESEADLDEEIKHLMALTQAPQYYPVLVELNTVASILSLLTHENMDIAIDAIELLKELTDEEVLSLNLDDDEEVSGSEGEAGMKVFVAALVKDGMLDLLVQNLARLDEEEANDRQGVFNTLAVFENLTSIDIQLAETIVLKSQLMPWMLKRLKVKVFDSNKQYCSELLAILMQSSSDNRKRLGELGGIDDLLQLLSVYKRKDPKDPDEIEMMENLFDCLCSSLAEKEIKQLFLEGEGIELMVIMIKEKKMARIRAVKVLDYAMSTKAGTANCLRFVEIMGLKTLFSIFSRKGIDKLKKAYKSFSEVEEEEHIIGILASLVRNLPLESGHRLRVVRKFVEEDYAKLERLLDLREGYEARVQAVDEKIARENEEQELDEDEIKEEEPLRALQRLDAGLYCMQLIDLILAHLCAENLGLEVEEENKANGGSSSEESESEIKVRAKTLLNRRGQSLDDIKDNLKAYLNALEVNEELALQARTKLLAQAGSGPLSEATTTILGEADKEEGEIAAPKTELTSEEDAALEALEAKESVQYMLGLL
ncbi:MAG: Catenin-beta-like protein [Podila humilis]|nr:MAG: Catenin-beta-like protein [Podila humilis]